MLSGKWRRCVGVLLGESLLPLCYLFKWVSLYLLDTSSCSLSTLCRQGGADAEFGLALAFISVTMEVLVRWRLCWSRGDLEELPVRFQGLAHPSLVFFLKMFVSLIHISNNFIEPSYPTLCLCEICHLSILIQNALCSDFLYVQNSELIGPTHFWRTFLLLHQ